MDIVANVSWPNHLQIFLHRTVIRNTILERINATSKSLQSMEYELLKGSILLRSLENFIEQFREEFGKVEKQDTDLSILLFDEEHGQARRPQKRKLFFNESKEVGHEFSRRENFIVNSFYVKCDSTKAELARRKAY